MIYEKLWNKLSNQVIVRSNYKGEIGLVKEKKIGL